MWIITFLNLLGLYSLCMAINSYEAPSCFENMKDCRSNLAHKSIEALKNKYLLFIGDSLTRYQYLSLVYTLRHRRAPHVAMYPGLTEHTHGEWIRFFETTNHMLAPYEQCDCSYYNGRFFEHRRYYDPKNNISVTYIMYRGFFIEGSNDTNSLFAPGDQELSAPQWEHSMKDYLQIHFSPKKVDYIVVNVGFFLFHESIVPAEFMSWCQQLTDKVIWKTTTYVQNETPAAPFQDRKACNAIDTQMCGIQGVQCMDTSWTQKVDQVADYWDSNHFREPVYSVLNDQLIEIMKKEI